MTEQPIDGTGKIIPRPVENQIPVTPKKIKGSAPLVSFKEILKERQAAHVIQSKSATLPTKPATLPTKPATLPLAETSVAAPVLPFETGLPASLPLKFSAHAQERMRLRNINLTNEEIVKLTQMVNKAAAKGAKESLILMKDLALVVSVKNRTVITAVDGVNLKENVFTNIDSAVIM